MSATQQNSVVCPGASKQPRFRFSRASIGTAIGVGFALLVGAIFVRDAANSSDLRNMAMDIRVGDDMTTIDARLGGSEHGYVYGWPSVGAPPTHRGALYGGLVNDLHTDFDTLAGRLMGGLPSWYGNRVSQRLSDWPIRVEFDENNRVTQVFIDGRSVTNLNEPANKAVNRSTHSRGN